MPLDRVLGQPLDARTGHCVAGRGIRTLSAQPSRSFRAPLSRETSPNTGPVATSMKWTRDG
jgi:hypothetical protein